ncbi:hypothetical protein [Spirillospora sp. NBC_01491]|uniref:hypothetical protein n=1 Tax=Spirillospora sp. NBC_01491 TaxID=2976007 RepID=UPI002E344C07|nr:hypothetical protein [Spirillospora sp. NBC_01491]
MKPWVGVPCELSELFRPHLDTLAEEMIDEILAGIPEYSRPHDGEYARLVRLAVEGALQQFVDLIGTPESSWEAVAGVYREIGRAEAWEGRSLDVLQTLLRLGARVAWRRLAAESEQTNVSRRTLASIAEAIFAFLDEIARAAPEGYTKASAGGGRAGAPAPPAARPGPARLGGGDGPDGRTEDTARSLRWAREALPLARRGVLPSERLIRCAEHMPAGVPAGDGDGADGLAGHVAGVSIK